MDDLAGLSRSHPGVALLMALFLFSLIGMPLTAGFTGKLLIFLGAMAVEGDRTAPVPLVGGHRRGQRGHRRLVLPADHRQDVLADPGGAARSRRSWAGLATLWICAALTLAFGIYPEPLRRAAAHAAIADKSPPIEPSPPGKSVTHLPFGPRRAGKEKVPDSLARRIRLPWGRDVIASALQGEGYLQRPARRATTCNDATTSKPAVERRGVSPPWSLSRRAAPSSEAHG